MLEQIAYEIPRNSEQKQVVYHIGDLESLSAGALYYGTGGSPLGNLGSFGIVKPAKNDVKKDGIIETIFPQFIGSDSIKIYINPLTGETKAAYQKDGEKHKDFSKSGKIITITPNSK